MSKTKKLTKTQLRERNHSYRRYGMVKVKMGSKRCWVSKQDKNGWSLGLSLGKVTYWLKNVRFKTELEVKLAVRSNIVFIHTKDGVDNCDSLCS